MVRLSGGLYVSPDRPDREISPDKLPNPVAQNRQGAALVGIDPARVSMMTFAISGALAAIAAALFVYLIIALLKPELFS